MTDVVAPRTPPEVSMASRVRLRTGQYRKYAAMKRWTLAHEHAAALGVPEAEVVAVVSGAAAPGESFIANCLSAFPELEFADLFEVVDDSEQAVPA